jgi:hypothetical protein
MAAAIIVAGGLTAIVVWSLTRPAPRTLTGREALMPYRDAWASAMRKAAVDATLPAGPTDVTALGTTGSHRFETTFTAEEITALVTVYTYNPSGQAIALDRVSVQFPGAGQAMLSGTASINGSSYSAEIAGPAGFVGGFIVAAGPLKVSVEGFPIGGERGRQAADAVIAYLNEFLDVAPGLSVSTAEITADGLHVTGNAPDALVNPAPATETVQQP